MHSPDGLNKSKRQTACGVLRAEVVITTTMSMLLFFFASQRLGDIDVEQGMGKVV
jgi:hypothetical protein